MSEGSRVQGKTVPQLHRVEAAVKRKAARDARTDDEQSVVVFERVPGGARKEQKRLGAPWAQ